MPIHAYTCLYMPIHASRLLDAACAAAVAHDPAGSLLVRTYACICHMCAHAPAWYTHTYACRYTYTTHMQACVYVQVPATSKW